MPGAQSAEFADDIIESNLESEAAEERQAAVLAAHEWNGMPLHSFSIRRETLYFRLRAINDSLPLAAIMRHSEAFLHEAMIILWLCAHKPAAWRPHRARLDDLMDEIEEWAESNIQRHQQTEAIELALLILRQGDSTRAVPRPSDRGREDDSGNSPCP